MRRDQEGFTLIEVLVVSALLSIVTVSFYQVAFSGVRGSDVAGDVVTISEEARLGLNRMIRDTREAEVLVSASATSFTVQGDFDRDGTVEPTPTPGGHPAEAEELTYAFDAAARTVTLNGEILFEGVEQIGSTSVVRYFSNNLRYDANGDGVTDESEINASVGNGNTVLDLAEERALVTDVLFTFAVRSGDRVTEFNGKAQMRNRRL
ncbi:MAG: PulJ/GspJ family protein [Actinomycetota bacterium]